MLYLDTSALAKLYIIEPESPGIRTFAEQHRPWLFTSLVAYVEVLSTLARCMRENRISRQAHQRQKRAFLSEWSAIHIVEVTPSVLAAADRLIEKHGLRGFDAVHLCSALWVGRPDFACFDTLLRKAASAEGLTVVPEM